MAILADANILLEVLLPNRISSQKVSRLLKEQNQVAISALTVHLVYYFALKDGMTIQQVNRFLTGFEILDLLAADYQRALALIKNKDMEDALQLAVALRSGCEAIATLDTAFAKIYSNKMRFIVP